MNALFAQCEKFRLPAELILVDWNPPADHPGLDAVLDWTATNDFVRGRVIRVPAAVHERLEHADRLPLFQMIAKNVGIRRARGEFVLATNIDIIFSDELMGFLAKQELEPDRMYRVDRYDTDNAVPLDAELSEQLDYCWDRVIRVHETDRSIDKPTSIQRDLPLPEPELLPLDVEPWAVHTNGCGDFTLLSHAAWTALRGYAEWEIFSFNIDSSLCLNAHYGGIQQVLLRPPYACFHIEHGSGWTPEGSEKLFARMDAARIACLDHATLMHCAERVRGTGVSDLFNEEHWGFGHLPTLAVDGAIEEVEELTLEGAELEPSRVTAYTLELGHERLERDLLAARLEASKKAVDDQQATNADLLSQLQDAIGCWEHRGKYIEELLVKIARLEAAEAEQSGRAD